MGRSLSVVVLGLAAALSASLVPHVIAFCLSLLSSFMPELALTRGQLSLVLLIVLSWSLRAGLLDSLLWAAVGGLCLDMFTLLPLGTSSLALVLFAYALNSIARQLFSMRIALLLIATASSTVLFTGYTWMALALLGESYSLPRLLSHMLLPTLVYNMLAVLPVYVVVRRLQRRLEGGLLVSPQSLTQGGAA